MYLRNSIVLLTASLASSSAFQGPLTHVSPHSSDLLKGTSPLSDNKPSLPIGRLQHEKNFRPQPKTSLNSLLNPAVLTASLSATSKLLSSIGIGALTTPAGPKQFGNILDGAAVTSLSRLTYWLFQPCFLLCGVASTLAKASSATGAGIPTSSLLLLPLAATLQISLGAIAAKCITTKKFGIRPMFLGIDTDDDASAADIRMCTTFANSGPLPLILADALFGGALLSDVAACVSFYLLCWSPLFWSLGPSILGLTDGDGSEKKSIVDKVLGLLSPPVMGSILGIIVGSSSIMRNLFITAGAPLAPVFGALRTFGVAYLPSAILVLAGSLVKKKEASSVESEADKKSSSVHPKTIISLLFSRFLLSPILALSTVRLLQVANLMPVDNARTLAIVTFTLLMEGCMPPAQNSVIMLQLKGEKGRAAKMAKLLTVLYTLSAIPVTLLLSGCLGISGILNFA
uniref:Uncharacterized protein n=1 Tax=Chaetoceros debilis TaxID=122233 RepID=A0A7S3Q171_9STRA|mmetsp:Transcript_4913/g.7209  ORF Transcript_4913/g.7209 Transcript_4913/m.7209 type:complete len:457 (+) Transcript_4913:113-1483(+)|eukprot:CAMPEP_0194084976 /NCGR_PEP_ID=MMETSP0149-20130528/15743_1 /TAXON_ID=122233 /ORGANISM="Chaetoceros debilis, Strain MM31A-1" /LENGTH=456 /DNA_ID=CAMNT_0038767763 /DNA_START=112 /DNA_END=1482 /DNA_ORIENTATION=+